MKTIQIEDEIFHALEARATGFGDTPNETIKRLLEAIKGLPSPLPPMTENKSTLAETNGHKSPLLEFVQTSQYLRGTAKDRYFGILRFLFQENKAKFDEFNGFKLGSRVQISQSKDDIETSGNSTLPKKLDETPYWVSTNLDNKRKRRILECIMQDFGYPNDVIREVLKAIPDSGIQRSKRGGNMEDYI